MFGFGRRRKHLYSSMTKYRNARSIETDVFGYEVREKAGINSKQKGNSNERSIAALLTAWTGRQFARTPSSGGLRWKNAPSVCGDVVCVEEDFNFIGLVETKHLKGIQLTGKLQGNSAVRAIYTNQLMQDVERAGRIKVPMLFIRINDMPKDEYVLYLDVKYKKAIGGVKQIALGMWPDLYLVGMYASDFFKQVSYGGFVTALDTVRV